MGHLKDAKKFGGVDLSIKLRPNTTARIPARWAVAETTDGEVTFEYTTEIKKYPEWAVRVVTFHEVCHIKHALKGLPLFLQTIEEGTIATEPREELPIEKTSRFNIQELDIKMLAEKLGLDEKDAVNIFQYAYFALTDVLVGREIKVSPVGEDNLNLALSQRGAMASCWKSLLPGLMPLWKQGCGVLW